MARQVQDAYIVAATRTPVGKAPRGMFRNTRPDDLLAHALRSALAQAPGLDPAAVDDVVIGCAIPEAEQGMNVARIGLLLAGFPNTVAGVTVNRFCASGLQAVSQAADRVRLGEADVMIAGGAEAVVSELAIGGFAAARALSTRNDDPATASRPWDLERDGFVLGEGAGAVVLEEYEHAKARGARIYCELVGYGVSADAHHMTAPPEDGDGAFRAMRNALKDAALEPAALDYINAHGTSTPLGDIAETIAVKRLLGERAARVAVNSTKSMTGHLLGAAGAVEAIFTALALRDQVSPPTINLRTPDPQCDLDYVPNSARKMPIRAAMSNSFGFGGTNGTLVFVRS